MPGASVVFAASLRFSERCVQHFVQLLTSIPDAQLLFWTGTGELPVHPATYSRVSNTLANLGFGERVGFDAQVARTCCALSGSRAIDCTFFWSRWARWLCGCAAAADVARLGSSPSSAALGERQPLVREAPNGMRTPNMSSPALQPKSMPTAAPPARVAMNSDSSESSV